MKQSEFVELWLQALESGEYKQGTGALVNGLVDDKPRYCCLGVACKVAVDNDIRKLDLRAMDIEDRGTLPEAFAKLIGLNTLGEFKNDITYRGNEYSSLASLNDNGIKFKAIAKIIREQIAAKNFEKVGR